MSDVVKRFTGTVLFFTKAHRRILLTVASGALFFACASTDRQVNAPSASESSLATSATESDDMDAAALTRFREPLSPHGRWVDDPMYGTIWIPHAEVVGADFVPYLAAGHWELGEDEQWTWISDYDWGWAPFHYGRWVFIEGVGWAWVPGSVYAPAWVVWRTVYDDEPYLGWAPLPPSWYWFGGVATRVTVVIEPRFAFVPSRYAFRPTLREHVLPPPRASALAPRSRPVLAPAASGRYPALEQTRGPSPSVAGLPPTAIPAKRTTRDPRTLPPPRQPSAPPSHTRQPASRTTTRPGGHPRR
jgi:uncharacterized protein DUF6600